MCNLSGYVEEKGAEKKAVEIVKKLLQAESPMPLEMIAEICGLPVEKVAEMQKETLQPV